MVLDESLGQGAVAMRVAVHHPRHDDSVGRIDHPRTLWRRQAVSSDFADGVALHQNVGRADARVLRIQHQAVADDCVAAAVHAVPVPLH
jgi:hypothetical protein